MKHSRDMTILSNPLTKIEPAPDLAQHIKKVSWFGRIGINNARGKQMEDVIRKVDQARADGMCKVYETAIELDTSRRLDLLMAGGVGHNGALRIKVNEAASELNRSITRSVMADYDRNEQIRHEFCKTSAEMQREGYIDAAGVDERDAIAEQLSRGDTARAMDLAEISKQRQHALIQDTMDGRWKRES